MEDLKNETMCAKISFNPDKVKEASGITLVFRKVKSAAFEYGNKSAVIVQCTVDGGVHHSYDDKVVDTRYDKDIGNFKSWCTNYINNWYGENVKSFSIEPCTATRIAVKRPNCKLEVFYKDNFEFDTMYDYIFSNGNRGCFDHVNLVNMPYELTMWADDEGLINGSKEHFSMPVGDYIYQNISGTVVFTRGNIVDDDIIFENLTDADVEAIQAFVCIPPMKNKAGRGM